MKKICLLLLLSAVFLTKPYAQQNNSAIAEPASAKKSNPNLQIDMSYGVNLDLAHRTENNMATSLTDRGKACASIDLRMFLFITKHWGGYYSLRINAGTQVKNRTASISQAYLNDYYIKDIESQTKNITQSASVGNDLGVVYRFEKPRWAIYSRLGFGINSYHCQSIKLDLKKKGSNELYCILTDNYYQYQKNKDIFIASLGVSVYYKISRFCYLFADVAYTQPLKGIHIDYMEQNPYQKYELIERQTYRSSTVGRSMNISAGIGFPIYLRKKSDTSKKKTRHRERIEESMEYKRKAFGLFPGNQ